MDEIETVSAALYIHMYVTCPNNKCGSYIDLLDESDTDGVLHNEDGNLLRQMFPSNRSHSDFECDGVVCTQCKTEFNVKELEW